MKRSNLRLRSIRFFKSSKDSWQLPATGRRNIPCASITRVSSVGKWVWNPDGVISTLSALLDMVSFHSSGYGRMPPSNPSPKLKAGGMPPCHGLYHHFDFLIYLFRHLWRVIIISFEKIKYSNGAGETTVKNVRYLTEYCWMRRWNRYACPKYIGCCCTLIGWIRII